MKKNVDHLKVTHRLLNGRFTGGERKAETYLTVTKETGEYNEPFNQISVGTHYGDAGNMKRLDAAIINITFSTGEIWSGTFENLYQSLSRSYFTKQYKPYPNQLFLKDMGKTIVLKDDEFYIDCEKIENHHLTRFTENDAKQIWAMWKMDIFGDPDFDITTIRKK